MTKPNPFTLAVRNATSADVKNRIRIEGQIAAKLVEHALKTGHTVSVHDGEEWVLKRSKHADAILNAMFSTDQDLLAIRPADGSEVFGRVTLIYGNTGYDVISDYSASNLDKFTEWMEPVTNFAMSLEDA